MAFLRDIRHAFRTLRRTPGLVCIAVLTLALGIGANTAIFSVIYSVLLKPLAFPDTDRIVQIWVAFPERSIDRTSWSHANFWDTRSMTSAFEEMGAIEFGSMNLTGAGDPQRVDAFRVNAGFFSVLRVTPVAGRLLRARRRRSGTGPERRYSDASILGPTVLQQSRRRRPDDYARRRLPPGDWSIASGNAIPRLG
jgi:putative ABC transport system permease protein